MQFFGSLLLALGVFRSALAEQTSKYSSSVQLSYTVLGPGRSVTKPLAEILYDPQTLKHHLASWTPPSTDDLKSTSVDPANSQLVRVSTPDGSSSVTTLSTFDATLSQYIDLWLSKSGAVLSASISSISPPPLTEEQIRQQRKEERAKAKGKAIPSPKPKPKTSKSKKGKKAKEEEEGGPVVKVNLFKQTEGAQPKLNSKKAPVVDSEGKEVQQEEIPEKTFFQKYWWVFLAGTLLMMTGGGAEK